MALPAGIDPSQLPAFDLSPASDDTRSKPGPIRAGLVSGLHSLLGLGGSAVQGLGTLVGDQAVSTAGQTIANDQSATAARVGRPDLEVAPWQQGGASVAPWLEYQVAKMVPTLAGYAGAQFIPGADAVVDATGLARLGATLPEFLGGAGLEAGASIAARRAALEAGRGFGKFVVGGGAFGGATGFGQAIQSADQKPGGVTASDAVQAAAESPLYAAAGMLGPEMFLRGGVGSVVRKALGETADNVVARTVGHIAAGGAVGAVQSGLLTAMDQSFRPDLSTSDKMNNIVEAVASGSAVGSVFGGATSFRALKRVDPSSIDTGTLTATVDQALNLGDASQAQNLGRLALPAPPTFVDAAGRASPGQQGFADIMATPRDQAAPTTADLPPVTPTLFGPDAVADRSAVPGSTIVVGRRDDTGRFTRDATGVEQPPVVPDDVSRSFRNMTSPELFSAANALANKGEARGLTAAEKQMAQSMSDEIAFRRSNGSLMQDAVPAVPAEAVSADANRRGTGEQNSAAPVSANDNIQSRVSELTQGLRLPAPVKDRLAQARSEHDIQNIVHDAIIVDGKSGKNLDELGKRAGMLDDNNLPTPLVDEVSARKTAPGEQAPTPAADALFALKWKDDVNTTGQKDPAVRALAPKNEQDAQLQIYRALGDQGDQGVKSDADGLERLAQKYGVLDENKQLTPAALEMAKRDPIPTEDSVAAAQAQGFKGAAASMFDKGVRSQIGESTPITKFDSTRAGEAYQAGMKWAEDTNSVPRGALKKYDPKSQLVGDVTDKDVARVEGDVKPQARVVPAEARQSQLVNEAIDNVGLHPITHESEIATLKSRVQRGDIEGAMDGLRRVQRGESLFEQPERAAEEPFKGETVTRGAPRVEKTAELEPTKATSRAEADKAIAHFQVSKAIDAARDAGDITTKQHLSLTNRLKQGRMADVVRDVSKTPSQAQARIKDEAARAARRSLLVSTLHDMLARQAREAEVPELNVDENGVLRSPRIGDLGSPEAKADLKNRADAGRVIEAALSDRTGPKAMIQELVRQGGDLGDVAKRFEKLIPDFNVRVNLPGELERMLGAPENGAPIWGMFDHGTNTLHLQVGIPHPAVALHEMIHAVTGKHIHMKDAIGREMISAYNRFKRLIPETDYAVTDAHEFMSEFMSRKQVRDWVKSYGDGKGSVFQRIWDGIRKMLGMPPRDHIEHIFSLAEAAGANPLDQMGRPIQSLYRSPPEVAERARDTVSSVVDAVDKKVDVEGAKGVLRRSQLYATTIHHITEHFGKWFDLKRADGTVDNGVRAREATTDFREAIKQRNAQLLGDPMDRAYALEHSDPKSFKNIQLVLQASEFGIHYARPWDAQTEEVKSDFALQPRWKEFNDAYRSLQAKGHSDIIDDLKKFNDIQMLSHAALQLHDRVTSDKTMSGQLPAFAEAPMHRFMSEQAREGHGLEGAVKFWNDEMGSQVDALKAEIERYDASPVDETKSKAERQDVNKSMNELRKEIKEITDMRTRRDQAPYFHLGRDGDYFVGMKVRLGDDGKVDGDALAQIADRLEPFGRVISPESSEDNIFIRVNDPLAQKNLHLMAEKLQKEGLVRQNRTDPKTKTTDYSAISGKRTDDRINAKLAGSWAERMVTEIKSNDKLSPADKAMQTNAVRLLAIDLMPDNHLGKMLAHRRGKPGYDQDMLRSYNQRAKVGIDALAGMAVQRELTDAYTHMREAEKQAIRTPSSKMSQAQRNGITEVIDELSKHDKEFSVQPRGGQLRDQLKAMSGAFFLSSNLAYPAVNMVQLPMLALPRLGSKYGYVNAARAMAKATPEAVKILQTIYTTGRKVSLARAADAVVTPEALRKAGVAPKRIEFLMQVANRGGLDMGGQSRELARNARGIRGSKVDQGLRIASSLGYYSETLSRLVVAIAEHQLHPEGLPVEEAATRTVATLKNSMWDYSYTNTSRMFGDNGILGRATGLATQFLKYTAMLNETLYREVHKAVGGDREAARFLAGHLAMTTVFAGTLGLPFATVFASAYDRLKDLFSPGDQPSDIQASFRNGLADMFGKSAAEIIARGTPRAAGIDLSTRVGEQDIFPFSKFIADRRDLKDSIKDLQARAWGAPSSMMLNMATGAGSIAQGDLEGGFRQMLPLGLSSMVKAYQMTDKGYTDSKGNVLPMDPSAGAILAQAVGFNPAQNAEYNEARSDQMQRQGLLARRSADMRRQIADAMLSGDHETARGLIQQAVAFDRANPAYGVLRGVEGSIESRRKAQAVAAHFGTPLGVSPKDMGAPQFTRYADVDYSAQ